MYTVCKVFSKKVKAINCLTEMTEEGQGTRCIFTFYWKY